MSVINDGCRRRKSVRSPQEPTKPAGFLFAQRKGGWSATPYARRACPTPGCPAITAGGPCPACAARREALRGTAAERGYTGRRWAAKRKPVLRRDPVCRCQDTGHGHGPRCYQPATVPDHWPRTRKELLAAGVTNPDLPEYMRGLCTGCHNKHTAATTPGGWNAR